MEGIFGRSHGCLTPVACFYQENINLCTLCIDFVSSQCAHEGPFIEYYFAKFKTYNRIKDSSSERIIQNLAEMILFKFIYQKSNQEKWSFQYNGLSLSLIIHLLRG